MHERFRQLAGTWRKTARFLEQWEATEHAALVNKLADELVEVINGDDELLNLTEAANLSGYSRNHIGQLVKTGKIPNRGRPNAPKVARKDVPLKPGHLLDEEDPVSLEAIESGQVLRDVAAGRPHAHAD